MASVQLAQRREFARALETKITSITSIRHSIRKIGSPRTITHSCVSSFTATFCQQILPLTQTESQLDEVVNGLQQLYKLLYSQSTTFQFFTLAYSLLFDTPVAQDTKRFGI